MKRNTRVFRTYLLLLGVCVLVGVFAVAAGQGGSEEPHVAVAYRTSDGMLLLRTPSPRPPTSSPEGRTLKLAESLLARLILPTGATTTPSDPSEGQQLGGAAPPTYPAVLELVEAYRFVRLPGTPQTVIARLKAHPPAGSTVTLFSTSGAPEVTFSFPTEPEKTGLEWLELSTAPAQGGGTALRASAVVEWLPPRPRREHIPTGVRAVTIHVSYPRKHINLERTVTGPTVVRRIIATVEALPRATDGISSCGDERPGELRLTLTFRRTLPGRPVAQVVASESGCAAVTISVAGHQQPVLSEPSRLVNLVQSILNTGR